MFCMFTAQYRDIYRGCLLVSVREPLVFSSLYSTGIDIEGAYWSVLGSFSCIVLYVFMFDANWSVLGSQSNL